MPTKSKTRASKAPKSRTAPAVALRRHGSVTLTIDQIKDLAEMAGLTVGNEITDDDRETEITVTACPAKGVDDDGTIKHYRHLAYYEEYPEEGVYPLGPQNVEVSHARERKKET